MTDHAGIPRRTVPGTSINVSVLGFDLDPRALGPPSSDDRTVAFLRRARALGISTFRVPTGAGATRIERLLAASLPTGDPEVVTIGVRALSDLATESAREPTTPLDSDLEVRLRRSLETSAARLGGNGYRILEWRAGTGDERVARDLEGMLARLRTERVVEAVARPISSSPERPDSSTPDTAGSLRTGPLSLLETEPLPWLRADASSHPLGFLGLDPFAGGRLDGSRFGGTAGERRPDLPPPTVRELHREFDPVVRLGFLTESRQRTLAQAALQFLYYWPWVSSVLVPLPSPERLLELVDAAQRPPLTDHEIERVLALE